MHKNKDKTKEIFWRDQVVAAGLEVRRIKNEARQVLERNCSADEDFVELEKKLDAAEGEHYNCVCVYAVALRKRGLSHAEASKELGTLDNAAGAFEVALDTAFQPDLLFEMYNI